MKWYEVWFDSPYYHLLYDKHDMKEAAQLVNAIHQKITLPSKAKILDVACGSGRFTYQLHLKGFDVTGFDLSDNSIEEARKQYGHLGIKFIKHNMLQAYPMNSFDMLCNFFTSFGYFGEQDMKIVLQHMHQALSPNGLLLIDYLNIHKIIPTLPAELSVKKHSVDFDIKKFEDPPYIKKQINITDVANNFTNQFEEKVYMLSLNQFEDLFKQTGFSIQATFGNYELDSFDKQHSSRLILLAKRI